MSQGHEERSPTGKPMVPATPRDVIHIRLGSFVLFFVLALGVLTAVVGARVLTVVLGVVAVVAIVDIALAVRRQKRLGGGPASME
jgi:hypothetical protein